MKKLALALIAAGLAATAACSASTAKPIPQPGKIDQTTATTSQSETLQAYCARQYAAFNARHPEQHPSLTPEAQCQSGIREGVYSNKAGVDAVLASFDDAFKSTTTTVAASNGAVKQNAQVTTTAAPKTPQIDVSSVTPSGVAVSAMFQINNATADEFRFEWAKFTLTYPDGITIAPAFDPNQAPYEAVAPNGIYAGGGNFYHNQTDPYASKFIPGHYVVRYDGTVLKEADL